MSGFQYDSWCGLYCGACDVLVACEIAEATGTPARWEELPERFQKNLPRADVVCHGCKSDTVYAGCAVCLVRKCARKQQGIDTCLDCSRFPCFRFGIMRVIRGLMRMPKKLPHLNQIQPNHDGIRTLGVGGWLVQQDAIWRCPACGQRYSWYEGRCGACGQDLSEVRSFPA